MFVWKTEKNWAGGCRQFVLKLDDGTIHRVDVQFEGRGRAATRTRLGRRRTMGRRPLGANALAPRV